MTSIWKRGAGKRDMQNLTPSDCSFFIIIPIKKNKRPCRCGLPPPHILPRKVPVFSQSWVNRQPDCQSCKRGCPILPSRSPLCGYVIGMVYWDENWENKLQFNACDGGICARRRSCHAIRGQDKCLVHQRRTPFSCLDGEAVISSATSRMII